jgi:hypothetical protein
MMTLCYSAAVITVSIKFAVSPPYRFSSLPLLLSVATRVAQVEFNLSDQLFSACKIALANSGGYQ